jgi:hypothetical protein
MISYETVLGSAALPTIQQRREHLPAFAGEVLGWMDYVQARHYS